jgi:hypothetical protein
MYVCVCVCVCVGVNHAGRQMGRQADLHLRRLPPALADYLEHIAVIIIRHSRHEGHIIGLTVIQETIHGIAVEVAWLHRICIVFASNREIRCNFSEIRFKFDTNFEKFLFASYLHRICIVLHRVVFQVDAIADFNPNCIVFPSFLHRFCIE